MKQLLILISFLGISISSMAQGFGGGLFAGIATSQMIGDSIGGFHKAGFYGGAFTDYRFTPRSALHLELSFLQRGSRKTPTVKNNGKSSLFNLNYIEIPILYRWYGIKNMNLEIGPSLSYLIGTKQEDENGELPTQVPFYDFDLSIAAGLSYYLHQSKKIRSERTIFLIHYSYHSGDFWILATSRYYLFTSVLVQNNN